jgi:hypothetical protein
MNIMYCCHECGGYCKGMFQLRTHYSNTRNLDEMDLVCEFCGTVIGRVFTDREICEQDKETKELKSHHEKIWKEREEKLRGKSRNKN